MLAASFFLFIYIFAPILKVEIDYKTKPKLNISQISPADKEFGIIIPKIGANSKIVKEVDPFDSKIYQYALTKGVAHARGTSFPDENGNMFIFSHSSANIIDARTYNSIFYLLTKLKKEDEIYIYYKNVKYKYIVSEIKIVDAKDVSYLNPQPSLLNPNSSVLTLMTCWPPGTTYKRLLVLATLSKN